MKQLFTKKGKVVINDIPRPQNSGKSLLVLNQYSLISAGTESSSVKSTKQNLFQLAKKNPENIAKVLKMIREKGIKNTYQQVKSILKGFYEFGSEIGYSSAGIVIDTGSEIQDICVGDFVACAGAGIANHAEVISVPRNLLVKIPLDLDLKSACSVTIGSIALQGVRQADLKLGETAAVIGLGLIGQITVQLLKANGCKVMGFDIDDKKIQLAKELGADRVINNSNNDLIEESRVFSDGNDFDAVIITASTSSSELINQAMKICRKKGRVVIVGAVGMDLKREDFYKKEIELRISCSYGPGRYDEEYEKKGHDYPYGYVRWTENWNMQEYLFLLKTGKVNFKKLISHSFSFENAPKAYNSINNSQEYSLAVILEYPPYQQKDDEFKKQETLISIKHSEVKNKIRVGLIGAGGFAFSTHLPNLQKLNSLYHLRAIANRNGALAQKAAVQFGADYATSDNGKIFNDKQVDMVMITTRHDTHAPLVIKSLEHNKIVFVEKPLAINHEQLEQVKITYLKNSLPLLVGFNRRFSPWAQKVKEMIKDRKNPLIINYRMNAGFVPLNHWVHSAEGGGRIIGEACHIFDLFSYFIGSPHQYISACSVNPQTGPYSHRDNIVSTIKYKDGSIGNLIYTAMGSNKLAKEYFEIFCEGKIYTVSD